LKPEIEIKMLKNIIHVLVNMDIGIYPKAFVGKYKKRTDFMKGWNAASIKYSDKIERDLRNLGVDVLDDGEVIYENKI